MSMTEPRRHHHAAPEGTASVRSVSAHPSPTYVGRAFRRPGVLHRNERRIRLLAAVVAALSIAPIVPLAQPRPPHVVMISIDGLMPSGYTGADRAVAPTLARLAADGAYADGVIGVAPTVTYPSHTTLITGVSPAVHGIYDNEIFDPEGRSGNAWHWYAREIRVPTLVGAVRSRGLRAAAVTWPVSVGMDADYLFPEFWRSDHPETLMLLKALSRPADLLDTIELGLGRPLDWPLTDRSRTDAATFILRTYQPKLLLLHLLELDSAQHDFGPGSSRARETLGRLDGYLADIRRAIAEAKLADRTYVVIVSDHGFLPVAQMLQPNALFKDEGLLRVDARGRIVEWQAYFHASGGSGFVYLKDRSDAALRERVYNLLERLASDPARGVRTIWTAADLGQLGAHPEAVFGLDMSEGFYTNSGHDALMRPTRGKGGHGFDPRRREMHAAFVIAGPGVARCGSLGVIRMTQVAPTIASVFRVGLSPEADRAVDGLVEAGTRR